MIGSTSSEALAGTHLETTTPEFAMLRLLEAVKSCGPREAVDPECRVARRESAP